jgi:hypothetical protein
VLEQPPHVGRIGVDAGQRECFSRFDGVEGEVGRAEFGAPTLGPQPAQLERGLAPTRYRELRTVRQPHRELDEHIRHRSAVQVMEVVQDDQDRRVPAQISSARRAAVMRPARVGGSDGPDRSRPCRASHMADQQDAHRGQHHSNTVPRPAAGCQAGYGFRWPEGSGLGSGPDESRVRVEPALSGVSGTVSGPADYARGVAGRSRVRDRAVRPGQDGQLQEV